MKSFLIFILSLALLAAGFFTRPPEYSFRDYLAGGRTSADGVFPHRGMDEREARRYLDGCTFADRILWIDVQKDGRTIYTGAFSHWFPRTSSGLTR